MGFKHGAARSRVFVYAAMGHVHRGFQKPDPRFFPSKPPLWMGQYLYAQLGNSLYVFGIAFRQADERLNVGTIDPRSVEWHTGARLSGPIRYKSSCRAGWQFHRDLA
jgi:hypothetical protein